MPTYIDVKKYFDVVILLGVKKILTSTKIVDVTNVFNVNVWNIRSEKRDIFFPKKYQVWKKRYILMSQIDVKRFSTSKHLLTSKKLLTSNKLLRPKNILTSKNCWRQKSCWRQKTSDVKQCFDVKKVWRQKLFDVKMLLTSKHVWRQTFFFNVSAVQEVWPRLPQRHAGDRQQNAGKGWHDQVQGLGSERWVSEPEMM